MRGIQNVEEVTVKLPIIVRKFHIHMIYCKKEKENMRKLGMRMYFS